VPVTAAVSVAASSVLPTLSTRKIEAPDQPLVA
jgi:hypothetical protein